jgi:RNA polymerase sigma-70 factor (ECF subfamily)
LPCLLFFLLGRFLDIAALPVTIEMAHGMRLANLVHRKDSMFTTSGSLLEQLRRPDEEAAWARFVKLYTPLIYTWGRRMGVPRQEAIDLVQDVLTILVQKLPEFSYDRSKSFRSWLRTVTLNKLREQLRRRPGSMVNASDSFLDDLARSADSDTFEEKEYRRHLVRRALQLMQGDFAPTTWKACWEHIVSGRSAAEVGRELGISEGAVYVAKYRVLRRLRETLSGLLD